MTRDIIHKILDPLNPQQREAVTTLDGPVLIVAGAGSGKTRAITHRMAYLIVEKQIPAWNIFAATFTNKAADEMRHRVLELLNLPLSTHFSVATFHSHCASILRREAIHANLNPDFTICDERDQLSLIKKVLKEMGLKSEDLNPGTAQWFINQAKMKMQEPDELENAADDEQDSHLVEIYKRYQQLLAEGNAVDFEDLIYKVVKAFSQHPEILRRYQERFKYILIDEYQDTNHVQFCLVRQLADLHRNVCVVGDEDQSIYSWRGAEIANLLEFPKHFPGTRLIKLEQNYRSFGNILKAASHVIENNKMRIGKNLWTDKEDGPPLGLIKVRGEQDEAQIVAQTILHLCEKENLPASEIAIFYRQNSLSRIFEDVLRDYKIPYRIIGGIKFYERAEIKDCLSYLHVIANTRSSMPLWRIINKPNRGIGEKTIEKIQELARIRNISPLELMMDIDNCEDAGKAIRDKVKTVTSLFEKWGELRDSKKPSELLKCILDDIKYFDFLKQTQGFQFESKKENVEELVSAIRLYEKDHPDAELHDYLNSISLLSDMDEYDETAESVSLMTVHCAKGLEFDTVFTVGLEDGIFPSIRAFQEQGNLEEERRLFYVALTRAKRRFFISYTNARLQFGRMRWNVPSPFLYEIPRNLLVSLEQTLDHSSQYALRTVEKVEDQMIGRKVEHPFFGEGTIVEVKGDSNTRKLIIAFSEGFVHEVLEKYAQLKYL